MRLVNLVLIFTLSGTPPVASQTRVPNDPQQIILSFAPLVQKAAPAVVNIYASRVVAARQSPFADDPFFSQFFNFGPSVPRVQNSLGSGVIVQDSGIVVSNYHVVGGADDIRVVLADKREFAGKVILADEATDLAVIQLSDAKGLPSLALADSDLAEVGDLVLAIGNPFGVGQTVTTGIVSGLARAGGNGSGGRGYFIQTDAAINPGNSGGALVDMHGRLLGINTSILTRSGGSNGIGFAIPANLVAQYVSQAEAGKTQFVRPWSGMEVQSVDADLAGAMGLAKPQGVIIARLHPDSPFADAGLRQGDVLVTIDNQPVDGPAELDFRLSTRATGATARAAYWRDGQLREADIALKAAPDGDEAAKVTLGGNTLFSGLSIAPLSPAIIETLRLPLLAKGVVVTGVAGRAQGSGLRPGDILIAVNGVPINRIDDMMAIAAQPVRRWQIEYVRGGRRAITRLSDR